MGFAAYSAVAHSRFRGLALLSLPLAAVLIIGIFGGATPEFPQWSIPLILFIPIMIVGNAIYVWRRRAGDSRARLLHLDAEHRAQTLRALGLERARIARELHDVVTHNVSVMVVQAGAARQVLADSPDQAREALLAVESTGRAAMTELRHLLGLLCAEDEPAAAPAGAADEVSAEPLRPQPGLGQVQSLISRVAATGLPVDLRLTGVPRGLPPGLDLAAYRVIQEGLTNVIKHAGRAGTAVRIDYGAGEMLLEVANAGPPIPAAVPRAAADVGPGAAGRGLLGLRERISLYGGMLTAGPRPAGGWLLRAAIRSTGRCRSRPARSMQLRGRRRDEPRRGVAAREAARVVIADDQTLVRSGFRMILTAAGIQVAAESADGREAVAAVLKHQPDVVLMDIRMPEMDGLEATRRIIAAQPACGCRIIMLTTFDLDQYVYAALAAGASGFLLKDVSPEHLAAAVRLVALGGCAARSVHHPAAGGAVCAARHRAGRPSASCPR